MSFSFQDWQAGVIPPKGWDGADAIEDGWSRDEIVSFIRQTVPAPQKSADSQKPVAAPSPPAAASKTVTQARTTEQAAPATVTNIKTRQTVQADDGWMMQFVSSEDGKYKSGITKNWCLFIENDREMCGVFAFDAFKMRVMLMRRPPWDNGAGHWTPRVLQDRDYSEVVMWLETRHMTPKVSNIAAVIDMVAQRNSFDRLDEYLRALVWDKKPRVAQFLASHMGAADSDYHRTVATRWLVSAVARALQPGCKVDTMPVFEGTQGALKSSAIKCLFGEEFFTDELSDIGSKDAMMEMQGVWCIEVAEMHRLNASGSDQVKKFLSRATDRYRPPYGRSVIEAPRRCLLAGTMNPEGNPYFKDTTGARRFWPVVVGRVDLPKITRDRDQLWAEAVQLYLAATPWWVQASEQVAVLEEQEKRIDVDVWTAIIAPALAVRSSISQWEAFNLVGILSKDAGPAHSIRVGRIMKRLGWEASRDRAGGEDRVVYSRPSLLDAAPKEDDVW